MMNRRLTPTIVKFKVQEFNDASGRNFVLYSANGMYGLREEGTHIYPGLGSLREVYTFLLGMSAALTLFPVAV